MSRVLYFYDRFEGGYDRVTRFMIALRADMIGLQPYMIAFHANPLI